MDAPKKRTIDPERQQLLLRRNRQLHGVALAALLALVILVFGLINILHPKTDFSETENRKLQNYEKPALSALLDGSYMQRLLYHLLITGPHRKRELHAFLRRYGNNKLRTVRIHFHRNGTKRRLQGP